MIKELHISIMLSFMVFWNEYYNSFFAGDKNRLFYDPKTIASIRIVHNQCMSISLTFKTFKKFFHYRPSLSTIVLSP